MLTLDDSDDESVLSDATVTPDTTEDEDDEPPPPPPKRGEHTMSIYTTPLNGNWNRIFWWIQEDIVQSPILDREIFISPLGLITVS